MNKENTIAELLERLNVEIQNPKDQFTRLFYKTKFIKIIKF